MAPGVYRIRGTPYFSVPPLTSPQVEAMLGGRFVLTGGVDDVRLQFAGLWANLASKLPPPSDAVATGKHCQGRKASSRRDGYGVTGWWLIRRRGRRAAGRRTESARLCTKELGRIKRCAYWTLVGRMMSLRRC